MRTRIKKNDKVIVLTGKDKGKIGDVLEVMPKDNRVKVAGVNMVSRHAKPTARDAGGMKRFESPIHVSNVAHVDPKDGKATRTGLKVLANGERALVGKRSGEEIRRI
jgi:large subunit ribosomal protein L24